jgi:hypothetical protein
MLIKVHNVVLFMFREKNEVQAFIGDRSLTLLFQISVARQLGLGNREVLKYRVDGDRLIVEKKYHNSVTGRTTVMEEY